MSRGLRTPTGPIPEDPAAMRSWILDAFQQITRSENSQAETRYEDRGAAPEKPRVGTVAYADGTSWDPGQGAGLYVYNGTSWVSLQPAASLVGCVVPYAGILAPSWGLFPYGQNVSRTTYARLMTKLRIAATITVTIASPGVVSWSAHPLKVNDPVVFRTTGALPTGITAGTIYFVISAGFAAGSFRIAATVGGAAINTSGSQSGVHTGVYAPHGDGDGSTTFGIPDLRGYVIASRDDMGSTSANRLTGLSGGVDGDVLGGSGGAESHVLTEAQLAAHAHTFNQAAGGAPYMGFTGGGATYYWYPASTATGYAGSNTPHNNVQPTKILNCVIVAGT